MGLRRHMDNLGHAAKVVFRKKCTALNSFIRRSKINHPSFYFKKKQNRSKVSRRKEIIKTITEIH